MKKEIPMIIFWQEHHSNLKNTAQKTCATQSVGTSTIHPGSRAGKGMTAETSCTSRWAVQTLAVHCCDARQHTRPHGCLSRGSDSFQKWSSFPQGWLRLLYKFCKNEIGEGKAVFFKALGDWGWKVKGWLLERIKDTLCVCKYKVLSQQITCLPSLAITLWDTVICQHSDCVKGRSWPPRSRVTSGYAHIFIQASPGFSYQKEFRKILAKVVHQLRIYLLIYFRDCDQILTLKCCNLF